MIDHIAFNVVDLERSRGYYHPDYYGAFALDPEGNNIEAVCHHDTR